VTPALLILLKINCCFLCFYC